MQSIVVPARFNGPATSGNGGWVSGRLAALLEPGPDEAVRVVLRSPPPLDVPLQLQVGADGGRSVWSGDTAVAAANRVPWPFGAAAPAPVPWSVALGAAGAYGGAVDHPFPTCFACGPLREPGDGLRLTPGRLDDRPTDTAAVWVPDASVSGAGGSDAGRDAVDPAVCWAALDCPGGWSLDLAGRAMVLGTMTAQVRLLPRVGGRYVIVGRVIGHQGRKAFTETALYDADAVAADPSRSAAAVASAGSATSAAWGLSTGHAPSTGEAPSTGDGPSTGDAPPTGAAPSFTAVPLARATAVWLRVDPATVRPA